MIINLKKKNHVARIINGLTYRDRLQIGIFPMNKKVEINIKIDRLIQKEWESQLLALSNILLLIFIYERKVT